MSMALNSEPWIEPYKHTIFSREVDFSKELELNNLNGKTILLTGGASGFGAACAQYWAENGANIMIGDINNDLGLEVVAKLRKITGNQNHHFFKCDVTQWDSQAAFFKAASEASPHGGLDVVVANAGIADGVEGVLFENPPDYSKIDNPAEPAITRILDVNLRGVHLTTHLALSYLPRNPGSVPCSINPSPTVRDRQLILISSIAGVAAIPKIASYCSAKHGVVGLFRCLRITAPLEHGIRVNMLNPYFVQTPMLGTETRLLLAGGSQADIGDIVNSLTRFATDHSIIGRGLVVGSRADKDEHQETKLPHGGPVWDVYADDFGQTDIFVRRIVGIINMQTRLRGWIGMLKDVATILGSLLFAQSNR